MAVSLRGSLDVEEVPVVEGKDSLRMSKAR